MKKVEFWFSIGSTYTFLTVMRIRDLASSAGIDVVWRPFSVRRIMQQSGNVPFVGKPAKLRYMWRDIERRAAGYGLPVDVPAPYPLENFDLDNRVATVAAEEGWCPALTTAFYREWFQAGPSDRREPEIAGAIGAAGHTPGRVLSLAESDATGDRYSQATDAAERHGIFGSPSFVTADGELFWGDDRLEAALSWAVGP
ncbi:MAG: DsbA family protein [Pseudomonadota bacterium]